jgi:hypothetical protein
MLAAPLPPVAGPSPPSNFSKRLLKPPRPLLASARSASRRLYPK